MLPKVSILIPCYNAEKWIKQAIESALNQEYSNKEVIVIDDGSTDNSLELITSFGNQINWKSQPNQGGNFTRNCLLELSTGEWIQYLDADDYLLPNKILDQVNHIRKFKQDTQQLSLIYSPVIVEYVHNEQSSQVFYPIQDGSDPWVLLARWMLPQTGASLWRKSDILEVGGWKENQTSCQEHELYLRLLQAGKVFSFFNSFGAIYRIGDQSTVSRSQPLKTMSNRLSITDELEKFLISNNELNQVRQNAINQSRLDCARVVWNHDRLWARNLINQINIRDSKFIGNYSQVNLFYKILYQCFGFSFTEKLATWKRLVLE
ncbi:MAG: glycosyltransferase [Sphaerospermopsis sp. SIO1G2]|nr:glycosyltransferase [Sphaerospermopsis sp. SIO1G2]